MRRTVFICFFILFIAAQIYAGESRRVSVSGEGEIEVEPDIAEVSMGVLVFDKDLMTAKVKADSAITMIFGAYEKMGLSTEDIKPTQLYVKPEYKMVDKEWKFMGYEITRSIEVTLREIEMINELINRSIAAGANRLKDIGLSSSRKEELKDKTMAMAIEDAKSRAENLASGFGAQLGKVIKINEGDDSFGSIAYSVSMLNSAHKKATFQPGRIKITNKVDAVFELKD